LPPPRSMRGHMPASLKVRLSHLSHSSTLEPPRQRFSSTFDMSGMTRLAGACPLDGGVMSHAAR